MVLRAALLVGVHVLGAPAKAPELPPAPVTLTVTPGAGTAAWEMSITNTGASPVRIPADPRLLVLELTPQVPGKKGAAPTCQLPDDARPATDEERELVIPAKRTWSATFDPLFYCFGARERAALVSGTKVTPRFGFTSKAKAGPYAVAPVGASVGKVAPAKIIDGVAFTIADGATAPPAPVGDEKATWLSVPEAADVGRGAEIGTTVSLHNTGDRAITLLYRPEFLAFRVISPSGAVACGSTKQVAAPIRELFSTVRPKGRADLSILVTAVCPAGTFDEPGIYRVMPRLDTTGASGQSLGLKSWDSTATAKTPLLLRVRTARRPSTNTTLPTLD